MRHALRAIVLTSGVAAPLAPLAVAGQWVDLGIAGPPARWQTAAAYDPVRAVVVLYGGRSAAGSNTNDTWEFDGTAWTQRTPTGTPLALRGHAMYFDASINETFLYGGITSGTNPTGQAYFYNGSRWNATLGAISPGSRLYPAIVWDPARNTGMICGGSTGSVSLTDTWTSVPAWALKASSGLGQRAGHTLFFDPSINKSVTHGGASNNTFTLLWNGTSWEFGPFSGPASRWIAASAYDAGRARGVLFGGGLAPGSTAGAVSNETWEWNGSSWSLVDSSGPASGQGAVMFYHAGVGKLFLYGGADAAGTPSGSTYVWTTSAPCYPNCDASTAAPLLTAGDFTCFLTKFRAGDAYANCDGNTDAPTLSAADFTCFLTRFRAGCP